MLSFMTLVISLNLGFQNNLNEIAYFSQTTNSAIKSQISKALFTLLATWSHSFLMRAGDIQWHKWQRQDKVEKSLTLCKWALTLGTDYQWKWVNMLYLLSDIAVECQCDGGVNPIRKHYNSGFHIKSRLFTTNKLSVFHKGICICVCVFLCNQT